MWPAFPCLSPPPFVFVLAVLIRQDTQGHRVDELERERQRDRGREKGGRENDGMIRREGGVWSLVSARERTIGITMNLTNEKREREVERG
jgi:hypothetical protein